MSAQAPLSSAFGSIKTRLAVLVGVSVLLAAVVGAVGTSAGVPLWLAVPATVALALVVTRWLATGITAPLREMTRATRAMSDGRYEIALETTRQDEVGELARSFTAMAGEIRAAEEHRRRLVATVAHELRTPLAGQQALLENLVDGVIAPGDDALQRALAQSERLGALVGDLLDLSRSDQSRVPLTPGRVVVAELLESAKGEAALLGREVSIEVSVEPVDLTVIADRARLAQVVANLLDNAVRHSPVGGIVEVAASTAGSEHWRLTITDEGPGLPPSDADRLTRRFGSGPDSSGGTGLGLAIAGWAASLHGGSIDALPAPGAGGGARLQVTLPTHPGPDGAVLHQPEEIPMSTTELTTPSPDDVERASDEIGSPPRLSQLWPERDSRPQPRALLAAAGVGLLAALLIPGHPAGLGLFLVLLAGGVTLWLLSPRRVHPWSLLSAALAVPLALSPILRADFGMAVPAVLAAGVLAAVACTGARTLTGMAASVVAWVAAGLRGLPLLDRTLRALGRRSGAWSVLRAAALSMVLLIVFGGLLASSDAVLGSWLSALTPQVSDDVVVRIFTLVFFAGVTLCGAYLAINPPTVDGLALSSRTRRRVPFTEWQVPMLVVLATFVAWLAAQAASLIGGHDYVLRTTGVTYAESARQGFGQLVLVTLATIALVSAVRTWGSAQTAAHRRWRTGLCAALCLLALLVVGSALHRMALYQEAYGWTVLRVGADLLELSFGVVLLALLVSLVTGSGRWVGRVTLVAAASAAMVFSVGNVSAFVAERNIARFEATGQIDSEYLASLGADAAPTVVGSSLPEQVKQCALARVGEQSTTWTAWNLGRERARAVSAPYLGAPDACPAGERWR
ncbi:hypothetical protein GCM10022199_26560 [Marihabitans asiaticum]|uniref:Signal transduction histidine-protein kinase/phosphatase MprB n=1 Tax=Marihabitans asiaticum TaxID=415218 RepID=A0A560WCR4_9MICO|nr:DUF4153 domain-containing protein [Marihabitans asiaticum]TWD15471.1 signal transduction histidine kinase [Marihabitans asiaticum]